MITLGIKNMGEYEFRKVLFGQILIGVENSNND